VPAPCPFRRPIDSASSGAVAPGFRIRIEAFLGIVLLIAVFVVLEFHAREGNQ